MIRDFRRNDKYFEDYIISQNKRIDKFKTVLSNIPMNDIEKRRMCIRTIANFQKDLFCAKYSIGAESTELRRVFNAYISSLSEIKIDEYTEYIDALAIGILLDYDVKKIKSIAYNTRLNDGLAEALINPYEITKTKLLYGDNYQMFFNYLTKKISISNFINYLTKFWYNTNKDLAWYDSDKSNEDIYTGYWCWLAGACLKITHEKIDLGFPYIPYDLLISVN